eukprot:12402476-Karenia_brevis.AAC.1
MDPGRVVWNMKRAIDHLMFVLELYQMQIDGGRHFVHEHPAGASSWKLEEMLKFMQQEGIISDITNMCCFGMEPTN